MLLEANAGPNAEDDDGNTALMIASSSGLPHVATLLLARGAKFDARNREGYDAVDLAMSAGNHTVVEILRTYHSP
jgi:ankyrin repeat protein